MNKNFKAQQGGFTLIELIVVIVILGILAATALPRFANLGGEARAASLNAARGSLTAVAAMAHSKYLVNPKAVVGGNMTIEGVPLAMDSTSGYPKATSDLATAAGLATTDYTLYTKDTADAPTTLGANQIAIVPNSIAGTDTAKSCHVVYTEASGANTAPTAVLVTQATADGKLTGNPGSGCE